MNKRSLRNKIAKKLDQLQKLLDEFEEIRVIDSDDTDTWDSDALYNLSENLKEVLNLFWIAIGLLIVLWIISG